MFRVACALVKRPPATIWLKRTSASCPKGSFELRFTLPLPCAVVAEPRFDPGTMTAAPSTMMPPPGLAPGLPPEEDERHPHAAAAPAAAAGMRTEPPGSHSSESYDPWVRQDPWNRMGTMDPDPANAEYIQFLQWRQANAPPRPPTPGANRPELVHLHGMGGMHHNDPLAAPMAQWGYAARDEAERTTAGPPPEWDGVQGLQDQGKTLVENHQDPGSCKGATFVERIVRHSVGTHEVLSHR